MRRPFVKLLALLVLAAPLRAASWEDESKEWEKMSGTRFYKDPGYAAKLSLNFLPVDNGHFYVGEVSKGVWFSLGETAGAIGAAVAILNAQSRSRAKKDPTWTGGMIGTAAVGGVVYLGLKVWSAFDAAEGARRYNAAREKEKEKQSWRLLFDGRRASLAREF